MRKRATFNGKVTDVYRMLETIRDDLCEMIDEVSGKLEKPKYNTDYYLGIVEDLSNAKDCVEEAVNILDDIFVF